MKKCIIKIILRSVGVLLPLLFLGCNKDQAITPFENEGIFELPEHFPEPVYQFDKNNFTSKGFELGRELFYDPFLSSDNTVSCASCHFQNAAFSDPGKALSNGVNSAQGRRNSPALFNLIWNTSFMWDGGINHIEIMPLAPITDPSEMNISMADLIEKLNNNSSYKSSFKEVFGEEEINDQKLFYALAQFMGALVSSTSKYDKYVNGETQLDPQEMEGLTLFKNNCASCHSAPLFTDNSFKNNGIDSVFNDLGREEITLQTSDKGKFKVPSLRNVALTYPYMHDGRFNSLEAVINHYSEGVIHSNSLSEEIPLGGFQFNNSEKAALLSFMYTLTDWDFVQNNRFSKPN